ncbi:MAG: ABC transporter ATP-binding protein [Firmicutes bacterium]|nr:ABC transporter ATP-binding protein [Bacillota bacterium]
MIEIKNLSKSYEKFVALDQMNFKIEKGSMFGIVGINGAGKSTLLRLMAGVMKADAGEVLFDGENIYENEKKKSECLFLPDEPFFSPIASGKSVTQLYKAFYDFDDSIFYKYIDLFGLDINTPLKNFSKGMKRRLFVAIAFASRPKYLLLDEVFDGLDPMARLVFKEGLNTLRVLGTTVVIASHSLRELEEICDSYALLDGKRVARTGSTKNQYDNYLKFNIAFDREITREELGFLVQSFETSGRIIRIACVGSKEEILEKITLLKPLIVDQMNIDFEELFHLSAGGQCV